MGGQNNTTAPAVKDNNEILDEDYLIEIKSDIGKDQDGRLKQHPLYTEYQRMLAEDLSFYSKIDQEDKALAFIENHIGLDRNDYLLKIKGFNAE